MLSCESITPLGGPVVPEVWRREQHWFFGYYCSIR